MNASSSQKQVRYDEKLSERVQRLASGRWAEVLDRAGVEVGSNPNKKTHCPLHEDKKPKFRFENKAGDGNWHCAVCGHGSGMNLLMRAKGLNFVEAAKLIIEQFEGNGARSMPESIPRKPYVAPERPVDQIERRRASYAKTWSEAKEVVEGDPVFRYLRSRIPGFSQVPAVIRFHPAMPFYGVPPEGAYVGRDYGLHPCMVSAVVDENGRCCNIHRTFLTTEGKKLALQEPDPDDPTILVDLPAKKLMPSIDAKHYQIRLAKPQEGLLGIAEGIETALAAMVYSGVPTWSVVATTGMVNFLIPEAITRLVIFADNDKLTATGVNPGLAAARRLLDRPDVAPRIAEGSLSVLIRTPETVGTDMVDFLQEVTSSQQWQLNI
ncbi:MAG: toprim domain-containing protein [Pseudomonadota bacterium]